MGQGDFIPIGGHRRKYDPAMAKKIKEGGKMAQKIRQESVAKHKAEEIPLAEEELMKELETLENDPLKKAKK